MKLSHTNLSGPFLALAATETTSSQQLSLAAWSLSPDVMQWGDGIWLLSLGSTLSYWKDRSFSAKKGLGWSWRQVLKSYFGEEGLSSLSPNPGYRAAIAPHPWAALLLLFSQQEHQVAGLCTLEGQRGQRLWAACSWSSWEKALGSIVPYFQKELSRFDPAGFQRAVKRLSQAANRLGLERPSLAQRLPTQGVRNRYGSLIAQLWASSFGQEPGEADPFIWVAAQPSPPPTLHRVLDHSPLLWEQVKPTLKEDFDRLSLNIGSKQVMQIHWALFREDSDPLHLDLCFRHPHHLASEQGEQTTALVCAQLSFESSQQATQQRAEVSSPITGWDLTLTRFIYEPNLLLDLFGGFSEQHSQLETLRRLENQLPIPLQRYQLHWDWQPENSYCPLGTVEDKESISFYESLRAAARNRPLLLRNTPKPLDMPPRNLQFCESTLDHWWSDTGNPQRDYYCSLEKKQSKWVFQDAQGHWYEQGMFS